MKAAGWERGAGHPAVGPPWHGFLSFGPLRREPAPACLRTVVAVHMTSNEKRTRRVRHDHETAKASISDRVQLKGSNSRHGPLDGLFWQRVRQRVYCERVAQILHAEHPGYDVVIRHRHRRAHRGARPRSHTHARAHTHAHTNTHATVRWDREYERNCNICCVLQFLSSF